MSQDMEGLQFGHVKPEVREKITEIGLSFNLMTQFTSFVAVDEVIFTGPEEPRRVDVPAAGALPSGINQAVMVTASGDEVLSSTDATVGTSVTVRTLTNLPIQGRNFMNLVLLAPGTVRANTEQFSN